MSASREELETKDELEHKLEKTILAASFSDCGGESSGIFDASIVWLRTMVEMAGDENR